MLTRRDVLKKTGIMVGFFLGADVIIALSRELPRRLEFSFKTNLKMLDIDLINETLVQIDQFGNRKEYSKFSEPIFSRGMDLKRFIEQYSKLVKKKFSLNRKSSHNDPLTFSHKDIPTVAGFSDAHLALFSSMALIMGNIAYKYDLETLYLDFSGSDKKGDTYLKKIEDIYEGIENLRLFWNIENEHFIEKKESPERFIVIEDNDSILKNIRSKGTLKEFKKAIIAGKQDFLYYKPVNIGQIFQKIELIKNTPVKSNKSNIERYLRELSTVCNNDLQNRIGFERAYWKSIFSKYTLLGLFINQYNSIKGREKLSANKTIIRGEKIFINKVLAAFFFIELVLHRIKLLYYQSASGIFNGKNISYSVLEIYSLFSLIGILLEYVTFDKKPLMSSEKKGGTITIKRGGKKALFKLPLISFEEWEMKRYFEYTITGLRKEFDIHHWVYTPDTNIIEEGINTIQNTRSKFLEALKKI